MLFDMVLLNIPQGVKEGLQAQSTQLWLASALWVQLWMQWQRSACHKHRMEGSEGFHAQRSGKCMIPCMIILCFTDSGDALCLSSWHFQVLPDMNYLSPSAHLLGKDDHHPHFVQKDTEFHQISAMTPWQSWEPNLEVLPTSELCCTQ